VSNRIIKKDHNVKTGDIAEDRLKSIVDRFERLDEECKALRSDQKDLMTEATSAGFDKAVLRQLFRIRKVEPAELAEQENLLLLYRRALGC
jgi:uncharacterized protein (UPF0335 family)